MVNRAFTIAAIASTVLLACTIFLFIAGTIGLDPSHYRLSFKRDFHIGVSGGRIVLFNSEYGPYHGSSIALADGAGNARLAVETTAFGETLGIYYRHFRWLDSGNVLWTAAISLAYPFMGFAVLPALWGWFRWRHAQQVAGQPGAQP
ncbi:MAG: hypothetical protein ABFC96_05770 [Thermoguttaceae bacterium]